MDRGRRRSAGDGGRRRRSRAPSRPHTQQSRPWMRVRQARSRFMRLPDRNVDAQANSAASDHPTPPQRLERRPIEPQPFAQHLVGVLAEHRRRMPTLDRRTPTAAADWPPAACSPALGCGSVDRAARARAPARRRRPGRGVDRAAGHAAASSSAIHSAVLRMHRRLAHQRDQHLARLATRSGLVAKRWSLAHSAWPAASQNARTGRRCRSPAACRRRRSESPGRARCSGGVAHARCGTTPPVEVVRLAWLARQAMLHVEQRHVDVLAVARAVRARRARPGSRSSRRGRSVMSVSATPTFCGPPPGSPSARPVMLIRPPMPWISKS